jgi:hypothetical protein
MGILKRNKFGIELLVYLLIGLMISPAGLASAGTYRIHPASKVTLYQGDRVVGEYTKEAPLPEDITIAAEGRCGIKMDDFYLVAEDGSRFSISTAGRQTNLFIDEGIIFFKTAAMKRTLEFITPNGQISIQRIHLNAAFEDSSIKGYVSVKPGRSELGVAEGGSMEVFTDKGLMTVQPGNKIILAQADMDIGLPEPEVPEDQAEGEPETGAPSTTAATGMATSTKVLIGVVGAAAIAGIAIGLGGGGGGGGDGDVSPSSP